MDDTLDSSTAAAPAPAPVLGGYGAGKGRQTQTPGEGAAPADPWAALPTKFQLKGADGQLDRDASLARLSKSYVDLERKLGGGQPAAPGIPASAAEYAFETPASLAGAFDPVTDAGFQDFAKGAHELGFTQDQMQYVLDAYGRVAPTLVQGAAALDGKAAEEALRQVWQTDEVLQLNLAHAERAVGGDPELLAAIRDRPVLIKFAARVGAEMREDSPPAGIGGGGAASSIDALMSSPAYGDASHPQHAEVSAKVRSFFARQPGAGDRL